MFRWLKRKMSISEHPSPTRTPYQLLGGEEAVKRLANRFYDIMETDPAVAELLAIHPQPMDRIRQKFFEFLSGWLGGPALFEQQYGHPRLRARHMPFAVTEPLRDQWMYCMDKALEELVAERPLRDALHNAFAPLATHMINQ